MLSWQLSGAPGSVITKFCTVVAVTIAGSPLASTALVSDKLNVNLLDGEFDYEVIGYESHPSIKAPLSN